MAADTSPTPSPAPASTRSDAVLEVRRLSVQVGGATLIQGLDVTLAASRAVGVTGPSGCGKSTLLRTLAGLIDPAAGQMLLRGRSPADHGWPRWRRQVVYVAQRPVLLGGSVVDNLRIPFEFRVSEDRSFPETRARDALAELDLPDDCWDRSARTLSEGQQQRVALLRALLLEPDVLLLDEPTSSLDPESLERCERFICADLDRRGAAALVATHDPQQAERLGDRQVALDGYLCRAQPPPRAPARPAKGAAHA